ncbi:MAG TPA: Nif3-like dinuclear metal center hexameric protein [Deltaproteobacteria bacterium]|nr:Nif3-like dinuclear metal center hexameric protein [Deltaproteobacteria bacterium]
MRVKEIITILDEIAPFDTAEPWDNVGLLVGDPAREIQAVVVALDPCFEAISYAKEKGAGCIVTHHPLFFHPTRSLNLEDATARKVRLLMCWEISLVSMHTNLDIARDGVADVLACALRLSQVKDHGLMRTGMLDEKIALSAWIKTLPFANIRFVDAQRMVHKVGVCPGSGMDMWREAYACGCDTFVTGDVRYHSAQEAGEAGINIIDLGHYGTEEIMVKPLMKRLQRQLPGIYIHAYECRDIFTYTKESED